MKRWGKLLNKKYRGVISSEIAMTPLAGLALAVVMVLFISVIYYGISVLFFSNVMIKGARYASVNPDVGTVRNAIYQSVTKILPESQRGITLFKMSDIELNTTDGDYVTTKAKYTVMLPGVKLYEKLGGSATTWTVPFGVKFSFLREY
ncbi:hypothetical protein [Paenibacillus sp. 1A_MP2]|uniref:hypothetical protein n=1 Tax=Paenibacillus sp. 1A_MP2 TaxID=3457495 RepID=UPI003FCE66DC